MQALGRRNHQRYERFRDDITWLSTSFVSAESRRALGGGDGHHGEPLSFDFGQAACNEQS